MSKLQLNRHQAETINLTKAKLEDALADGVENQANNPVIDPIVKAMEGYKTAIDPQAALTNNDKDAIKGSYMGTFAAFLGALSGEWRSPTYGTGWSNWADATYNDMQYKKNGLGVVSIRGLARKSATVLAPSTIFTLPDGFRPPKGIIVNGVNNDQYCAFRVESNGDVRATVGSFAAADGWWSLVVSFEAA